MCGRFVQYGGMAVFMEERSPQLPLFGGYNAEPISPYNVAPTTRVQICTAQRQAFISHQ